MKKISVNSGRLNIRDVPIGELKPAKYNPRDISAVAFEGLKESLKKFGMVDPIIVNTRTGAMVGGHQRLKAAESLGWDTVPVVHVDLSLVEEKALNVTLNNQRISGFYTEGLQDLLAELKDDFGDDFKGLLLEDLVVDDAWGSDMEDVDKAEENLDGLTATIKIKCPQDIKDEVLFFIKGKILETSFEGVEVV